jgi:hypothetical protein
MGTAGTGDITVGDPLAAPTGAAAIASGVGGGLAIAMVDVGAEVP